MQDHDMVFIKINLLVTLNYWTCISINLYEILK